MQHRTYVGAHDEVELAATGQVVRRGEQIEVDADLAAQLDEQPANWAKPNTNAAKNTVVPPDGAPEPDPETFDGQPITEESA